MKLQDARTADALAGVQLEMQRLHPGVDPHSIYSALDAGVPLARPTDRGNHSTAAPIDCEERTDIRRAPGGRSETQRLPGRKRLIERQPIIDRRRAAVDPMHHD